MSELALAAVHCASCGAMLGPAELSCPSCHALVHAARLKAIAATAQAAQASGDLGTALGAWREAVVLLPFGTKQRLQVEAQIKALSSQVDVAAVPAGTRRAKGGKGPLAGAGAAILVLASKGKLLLLGLAKLPTLLSMVAFFGVYWSIWGWKFALGLVAAIYVHEMGHVWELRKFGLPASAPMFIPGFGALVRLKARPSSVYEDARIGLAGPWWGLAAAIAAGVIGSLGGWPAVLAVAFTAGWMNMFNLVPVWTLDGSRGLASLSRVQRGLLAVICVGAGFVVGNEIFYLVGLVVGVRAFMKDANPAGDPRGFASFATLVVALGAVMFVWPDPLHQR